MGSIPVGPTTLFEGNVTLKKTLIALALTFFLAQAAHADTVIWNNPGGVISTFLAIKKVYLKTNERIVIAGWCASSCTMFLSLPNICVLPTAQMGFHKSHLTAGVDYSKFTKEELRESKRDADRLLWNSIPDDIKPLLGGLTRKIKVLQGNQLPEKYICKEWNELNDDSYEELLRDDKLH
jgi:hypothetical protein